MVTASGHSFGAVSQQKHRQNVMDCFFYIPEAPPFFFKTSLHTLLKLLAQFAAVACALLELTTRWTLALYAALPNGALFSKASFKSILRSVSFIG